ncbi:hypothetical protein [Catellatospora sp. NPDC049609]|uniref:hypothetical protein n=1 Tax=Catellatospora sp. NPDC049609 TaxID=3155505 RepID=UPI003425A7F8
MPGIRRTRAVLTAAVLAAVLSAATGCAGQQRQAPAEQDAAAAPAPTGEHRVRLVSHCGIDVISFDGRNWRATAPAPDPGGRADKSTGVTTYDGHTSGTIRYLDADRIQFTSADPALTIEFRPTDRPVQPCD